MTLFAILRVTLGGAMNLQSLYEQYGIYILFVPLAIALVTWTTISQNKKIKKLKTEYLTRHPDAVRVFLLHHIGIKTETITVYNVDGEEPALFSDKMKVGFYLKPGKSGVSVSYGSSRQGVAYKNVTKNTDVVELVLETEAGKEYTLSFDKKKREFEFKETTIGTDLVP